MIHLRVIAPFSHSKAAIDLLIESDSVANVTLIRGAAVDPEGDMITCDVASEDASYIVGDLRRMGIAELGAIDINELDASVSAGAVSAEEKAIGHPADAVIWENVSARIDNEGLLSGGMMALFAFAGVIAAIAILIDSSPIVVGAMALCPDFGPIAAFAVGAVRKDRRRARGGLLALLAGFMGAIAASFVAVTLLKAGGIAPENFTRDTNTLAQTIAAPDGFSVVVAFCAGAAGMLSVTLGKAGALVGVAVSITTIPAAADIGLSLSYGEWGAMEGAALQLAVNIASLLVAASLMLAFQRRNFKRRDARRREARAGG
ncbi:MAG: DUF389 domain-containing protein [Actinobacteria bacterium]|uniref:Unannotated protein n=1 Tax=freshwater metagenome TaxID=449393 RepID=A0A6J5ZYG7_9ZZZZ|nr:DUF389 domain-containing protein [Actinomycetota bacterium]